MGADEIGQSVQLGSATIADVGVRRDGETGAPGRGRRLGEPRATEIVVVQDSVPMGAPDRPIDGTLVMVGQPGGTAERVTVPWWIS